MVINNSEYEVLTSCGWKSFSGIKKSITNTSILLEFDDGNHIESTLDHLIFNGTTFKESVNFIENDILEDRRIIKKKIIKKDQYVYDLINVEDTNHYITNKITSHNCAFVENWEEFSTAIIPTVSSGKTCKIVLVSTPYSLNHFWTLWKHAIDGTNNFHPIKVTWQSVPGRDQVWKDQILKSLNGDEEKFNQEFSVEFLGSSSTLISITKLKELVSDSPINECKGLIQFKLPIKGHKYICTIDTSRGKGLDYSAFQIIDITEMPYDQVCVFYNNQTLPGDYAAIVHNTLKMYNNAEALIEINDIGGQISDILFQDYEYENIIYTCGGDMGNRKISSGFVPNADRGIKTTRNVKNIGCSLLKLLIEQNQLILRDTHSIQELMTFSKKSNTYQAEDGFHDDLTMCLVLFAWASGQQYFKTNFDKNTVASIKEDTEEKLFDDLCNFFAPNDPYATDEIVEVTSDGLAWYNTLNNQYEKF